MRQGIEVVQKVSGQDEETSTIMFYIVVSFVLILLCSICYALCRQCCWSSRDLKLGEGLGSNDLSKMQSLSYPNIMEKFSSNELYPKEEESECTTIKLEPVVLEAM